MAKAPKAVPPPHGAAEDRLGWIATYYPGVIDARAAAEIVLAAGSDLWGHDIRLKAAPMRRVRGTVLDIDGNPAGNTRIRAARTDETLSEELQTASTDDGVFEFPNLYDGEWSISAQREVEGVKFMAFVAAQVSDRELDPLKLCLSAPFTVRGAISLAEASGLDGRVGIFLRPPRSPVPGS